MEEIETQSTSLSHGSTNTTHVSAARSRRIRNQKALLIEGAAAVFAHQGLAHASVEAILKASGLGRGTFYRNFDNLEDIFIAVKEEASRRLFEQVAAAVSRVDDPIEQLKTGIGAYLDAVCELGDFGRVLYVERPSLDKHRTLRERVLNQFVQLFRAGLHRSVHQGRLSRVPDELAVYTVVAGLEAVAIRFVESGAPASEFLAAKPSLVELCLRALSERRD